MHRAAVQTLLTACLLAGLDVLDSSGFRALPIHAKLVATGVPGSTASDSAMQMSPQGLDAYGFARMGGGSIELGQELNASLVEVRMRVNLAQLSDENRGFLGRLSGTASASAEVFPSIDNVMVSVQNGTWRSSLTMKHSLTLDAAAFADVREKKASTGEVVGAIAMELPKFAVGSRDSSGTSGTREMEVVANPDKFTSVVGHGLASAASMVVSRLKTER